MTRVIERLFLLLLVPGSAFAQSSQGNWDNLEQLAPGQQIRIVLKDARSFTANFQSVTDAALLVRLPNVDQAFERLNVLRVSSKRGSHRRRNALIGLAAGAATGVVVGVASPELGRGKCEQGSCVDAGTVTALGVLGSGLGAGIGALIPTGGWHDIYRAQ